MSNVRDELRAPEKAIRHYIEDFGASRIDLMDIGLTGYTASKWLSTTSPGPLARTQAVQVAPIGMADTVALVPMGELGRRYLRHAVYIRDAQLRGQIRLRATHLGGPTMGGLRSPGPSTQRWRIGSSAAIPSTTLANLSAIMSEPDLSEWPGPATLVELGPPITIDLPLGFARTQPGGHQPSREFAMSCWLTWSPLHALAARSPT